MHVRAGFGMAVGQPGELEVANDHAGLPGRGESIALEEGSGLVRAGGSDVAGYGRVLNSAYQLSALSFWPLAVGCSAFLLILCRPQPKAHSPHTGAISW